MYGLLLVDAQTDRVAEVRLGLATEPEREHKKLEAKLLDLEPEASLQTAVLARANMTDKKRS